eukprot:TRINITY_DN64640_c0_g2_i4.p1 TRINITY_DN64640_c0_g2~~TRINITY_DN64640_c0_g2_i4.p1  ORF type:complete len:293 (-),score=56.70 TRINITY_DN64640_c0_g2_i4:12-890(-)
MTGLDSPLFSRERLSSSTAAFVKPVFFFREHAEGLLGSGTDAVRSVTESLLSQVSFLRFELDDGDAVARYFEELHLRSMRLGMMTSNKSPGVDLAEYDLLRNFLLGHFRCEAARTEAYKKHWLELERETHASDGDMHELERFLRYFLSSSTAEPATCSSRSLKQQGSLYGSYKKLVVETLARTVACNGPQTAELPQETAVIDLLDRMIDTARTGAHREAGAVDAGGLLDQMGSSSLGVSHGVKPRQGAVTWVTGQGPPQGGADVTVDDPLAGRDLVEKAIDTIAEGDESEED